MHIAYNWFTSQGCNTAILNATSDSQFKSSQFACQSEWNVFILKKIRSQLQSIQTSKQAFPAKKGP